MRFNINIIVVKKIHKANKLIKLINTKRKEFVRKRTKITQIKETNNLNKTQIMHDLNDFLFISFYWY